MLRQTIYENDRATLTVTVERQAPLLKSEGVVSFPRLIQLEGERLVLAYGRGFHAEPGETRHAAHSEDAGRTWAEFTPESPWSDNVQNSGILGHLRDGSIFYIDCMPANADPFKHYEPKRHLGPYHRVMRVEQPNFRCRRFSPQGQLIDGLSGRR